MKLSGKVVRPKPDQPDRFRRPCHGNKDEVVPEYHPDFIAKNIPNSKVHKFDEAGHGVHKNPDCVDEFHRIIEQFLSQ